MLRFAVLILSLVLPTALFAERVALVIGNSKYRHVAALDNPYNDAEAIGRALVQQGFDVTVVHDLSRADMYNAVIDFRYKADEADIAMLYYAGHAMEISGQNYLVPVDSRVRDARDARVEMIQVDDLLPQLSGARKMKMVVLDACRDNPFVAQVKREGQGRNVGRGLAMVESADANTLIAYAAAAGEVTPDGDPGANSPFTTAFLNALEQPPTDVRLLLGAVRDELQQSVPGAAPFVYSSLGRETIVINPHSAGGDPVVEKHTQLSLHQQEFVLDFASAEIAGSPDAWGAFLEKYAAHKEQTLYVLALRKKRQLEAQSGRSNEARASAATTAPLPSTPSVPTAPALPTASQPETSNSAPAQTPAPETATPEPGRSEEVTTELAALAPKVPSAPPAALSAPDLNTGAAPDTSATVDAPPADGKPSGTGPAITAVPGSALSPQGVPERPAVGIATTQPVAAPDDAGRPDAQTNGTGTSLVLVTPPPADPAAKAMPGDTDSENTQASLDLSTPDEDANPGKSRLEPDAAAREIQILLKQRTCYSSSIDGVLGRGSRAAMRRFSDAAGVDLMVSNTSSAAELNAAVDLLKDTPDVTCPAPAPRKSKPKKRTARTSQAPAPTPKTSPKRQGCRTACSGTDF